LEPTWLAPGFCFRTTLYTSHAIISQRFGIIISQLEALCCILGQSPQWIPVVSCQGFPRGLAGPETSFLLFSAMARPSETVEVANACQQCGAARDRRESGHGHS